MINFVDIIFIIAILINIAFSIYLMKVIKEKYPNIYCEYKKPFPFFITPKGLTFLGEFVVSGLYKDRLSKCDYKYVTRLRWAMLLLIVVFVIDLIYKVNMV